jgi:hypothetical protein
MPVGFSIWSTLVPARRAISNVAIPAAMHSLTNV